MGTANFSPAPGHARGAADPLPARYRILPASVEFRIPGFQRFYSPGDYTLAPSMRDCSDWFDAFVRRVARACGREYLPVCRLSDGEFAFMLGEQPPDTRLPPGLRVVGWLKFAAKRLLVMRRFKALTRGMYHSGQYTARETRRSRAAYLTCLREISEHGVLAVHLNYGAVPFQERYFPALGAALARAGITLDERNYVPFYFVYAALSGPRRVELLQGRRVLVVHGAQGTKRLAVEAGLRRQGVQDIQWCPISLTRSLFDDLDLTALRPGIDLALVGAGIGKPRVLLQLAPLGVPCLDAGFMFEVWADAENRWKRPVCAPDDDWLRAGLDPVHVFSRRAKPSV